MWTTCGWCVGGRIVSWGLSLIAHEHPSMAPWPIAVLRSPPQVQPYYIDFKCFVKKRWEGRTLVKMFSQVGGLWGDWRRGTLGG